jgi:NAD-dependent deacetylase
MTTLSVSPSERTALAALLRSARSVVALTGAGVSAPSGIPDFRSPDAGLWQSVDPLEVAHIDAFRRDPVRFWRFFGDRLGTVAEARPNRAHRALAALEARGIIDLLVTQNLDRLHRIAGSRNVIEIHGSIDSSSCCACAARHALGDVRRRLARDGSVPRCDCGEVLKPDVVLFGEYLARDALRRAFDAASRADVLLCVGSSLSVWPVAQLPGVTRRAGGQVAIVTAGPTREDRVAAVKLSGDIEDELEALLAAL